MISSKTYRLLTKTSNTIDALSRDILTPHGLNCNEFAILEILYQEGEQNIYQLGTEIMVASSSMTYLIDKLEKKDYLRRDISPKDRRAMIIQLTPAGQELMQEVIPEHQEKIEDVFSCFTKEETENIVSLLNRVNKNIETAK